MRARWPRLDRYWTAWRRTSRWPAGGSCTPVSWPTTKRILYQELADDRGEGEALFWVGIYHQVVARDGDHCGPLFARAYQLSAGAGDRLMMSYSARHLGFGHLAAGEWDQAHGRLAESVRLRRAVGHQAGVAAGLLALAELAVRSGRPDEAADLLADAAATAEAAGAAGTLRWVDEARAELAGRPTLVGHPGVRRERAARLGWGDGRAALSIAPHPRRRRSEDLLSGKSWACERWTGFRIKGRRQRPPRYPADHEDR